MSFENIIGNEKNKEVLNNTIKLKSIAHSYMFVGQEGIGKQKFAIEFAKMILCLNEHKENCSKCEACIKFNSSNHPDFIKIEPDGNFIKIAQMREMQEGIYKKPILSNNKVFIINNADRMTEEAQNSLLKTLEEPPEYVTIILIVSNENMMLNTIKSRCLKVYFNNISNTEMEKYIKGKDLNLEINNNMLDMCNGSFSKLEAISENFEKYIEVENLIENIIDRKTSIIDIFNQSEFLYKFKENIQELLEYMIVLLYNKIKENCTYVNKCSYMIKIIEETRKKLKFNSNYDMCIDDMLLKLREA